MTIRFVGVDSSDVSALVIIATFLVAYPLTLFPVMGLGILDAVLLAAYVNVAGLALEPELVAGLVVWRVVTVIGPIALGAISLAVWRSSPYGQRGFAGLDEESGGASDPGSESRSK